MLHPDLRSVCVLELAGWLALWSNLRLPKHNHAAKSRSLLDSEDTEGIERLIEALDTNMWKNTTRVAPSAALREPRFDEKTPKVRSDDPAPAPVAEREEKGAEAGPAAVAAAVTPQQQHEKDALVAGLVQGVAEGA